MALSSSKGISRILTVSLIVGGADIVTALLLVHVDLNPFWRWITALIPLPANVALVAAVVQGVRKLDAFQQRLHLEAVAMAFASTGLSVLTYGFLEKAHLIGPLNVGLVWALMSFFYALGYIIAARHYR